MDPNDNPNPTPEPTDADILAAMDAGIAGEPLPTETPVIDKTAEVVADDKTVEPIPGTPEALAAEQAAAEAAKAKEAEGETGKEEEAKADPDAETENEIASLGLKEKSAARFRELAEQVKAVAPLRAELEKLGVKDVQGVVSLAAQAKDGADLIDMVRSTGAPAEDFGRSLDYLSLVSAARNGDRAAAEKAYDVLHSEFAALCQALGKEVPGVFDPLAAHADLREEIEKGDITRTRAIELANQRNQAALAEQGRTQAQERDILAKEAQAAEQQALDHARVALNDLGTQLATDDPHYAAKQPALLAEIAKIRKDFPPSQWALKAALAYQRIPNPKPKPGVATGSSVPSGAPIRPSVDPVTDDPMEALNQGIAAASA